MSLILWLSLSATPPRALPEPPDTKAVVLTLEKLQKLRERLMQGRANDRNLAEQETGMIATLEDLEFALNEAQRATRLTNERLLDSRERLDELNAQRDGLQNTAKKAQKRARTALGLLLHGNHAGGNKPLLRAYERQRVTRAATLWDKAKQTANLLEIKRREVESVRQHQKRLRQALSTLLKERNEVRGLAVKRLAELRRDRRGARRHAAALEKQRLALARWLKEVKPVATKGRPNQGIKRGRLLPPVAGKIVNGYGWQEAADRLTRWRNRGLDLQGIPASPIIASARGHVAFVGRSPGLGQALVVDHGGGWRTVYGGVAEAQVAVGDPLEAGQIVGLLGDSGQLHFELRSKTLAVNPTQWFQKPLGKSPP
jgi:septal ring factor EnvC (AmiA/AmiB activator)